ncbi:RNA-directed DNA polymerase, eukaryota, reverse transcriptase zinc-binding domain protein [Tanacetum coccineum]
MTGNNENNDNLVRNDSHNVEYNVNGDKRECTINEDAEKREGSMEDMGCDVNVGCMSDDKKCNEDDEVVEQSAEGIDEGIKMKNSQDTTKEGNSEKKNVSPTEIDENGIEVVVFDDVMVAEGSKRWDLTMCGYFVGYRMSVNELRYNLRRMWSKYGFKDIVDCNNGKWSVDLKLDSTELDKIPLWVKLCNVPIEAWTVKEISVIASKVGKPLVMDAITTLFNDYRVFGHADSSCYRKESNKAASGVYKKDNANVQSEDHDTNASKEVNDGSVEVRNRKNVGIDNKVKRKNYKANPQPIKFGSNIKTMYQAKNKNQVVKEKTPVKTLEKSTERMLSANNEGKSKSNKKKWFVHKDILEAMKRSANKFSMFEMYDRELLVDKGKEGGGKEKGNDEEEDVLEEMNGIAKSMEGDDVKGCRLMVGWNEDEVRISVIHMARQSVLVKMETNNGSIKMYGTFICVSNGGLERKELWKDLKIYRSIIDVQQRINNDPYNQDLRSEEADILKLYIEAMKDEELILYQKAKKFLGKSKNVEPISDIENLLHNKLSNEEASYMIREVSDEEIKNDMFQIDDNKALGLFNGYVRKIGPKRVALKVDIQKAYDTVNWQFLEDILRGFRFHGRMVDWVMKCVTTTSFSICVNGESCGYFKGGRGLRQGDPMSPYLLTLVMEIITLIIKRKVEQNDNFLYHFGWKRLKITNVCFADDLLMFCHVDRIDVGVLKDSIDEFGKVDGLILNYNKSAIIFGCLNKEEKQEILEIMPFKLRNYRLDTLVFLSLKKES